MTNEEFSNAFDTLLSSYQHNSEFGDLASIADVTLDEYEKSIFLTLALDLIVKTYFEKSLNANGEGFDDSTRRLMDYSNLITVKSLNAKIDNAVGFSDNGILLDFSDTVFSTSKPLFIINERVKTHKLITPASPATPGECIDANNGLFAKLVNKTAKPIHLLITGKVDTSEEHTLIQDVAVVEEDDIITLSFSLVSAEWTRNAFTTELEASEVLSKYILFYVDTDYTDYVDVISFENNYQCVVDLTTGLDAVYQDKASYTVVPINYKDYDRMMSRAYCEPLKRQAWRLFETDSSTLTSLIELILRTDSEEFNEYRVRYVRRPRPIVLVNLSDTANALSIDGVSEETTCELNPVIHNEILLLAVQLALTSKGIETNDMKAMRLQASRQ